MNADDYQKEALRTAVRPLAAYSETVREAVFKLEMADADAWADDLRREIDVHTWVHGLTGEAGEVAELVKKGWGHGHGLDLEKVKNELGDILYYIAVLADAFGWSLSSVMAANVDKLRLRYPNGFGVQESLDKADER